MKKLVVLSLGFATSLTAFAREDFGLNFHSTFNSEGRQVVRAMVSLESTDANGAAADIAKAILKIGTKDEGTYYTDFRSYSASTSIVEGKTQYLFLTHVDPLSVSVGSDSRTHKHQVYLYDQAAEDLIAALVESGYPHKVTHGQMGEGVIIQSKTISCVSGQLSMDPHSSMNCSINLD